MSENKHKETVNNPTNLNSKKEVEKEKNIVKNNIDRKKIEFKSCKLFGNNELTNINEIKIRLVTIIKAT